MFLMLKYALLSATVLMLVALGGCFSEHSGVINLALEGIMVIGGLVGTMALNLLPADMLPVWKVVISICLAAVSGIAYSSLLAFSAINLKADQTIGGTALNLLSTAIALVVVKRYNGTQSAKLSYDNSPFIFQAGPLTLNVFLIIGLVLLAVSIVLLYKTRFGLRLQACGEHPQAAGSVGINVYKMRWAGVLISGFLGGIGGIVFITAGVSRMCGQPSAKLQIFLADVFLQHLFYIRTGKHCIVGMAAMGGSKLIGVILKQIHTRIGKARVIVHHHGDSLYMIHNGLAGPIRLCCLGDIKRENDANQVICLNLGRYKIAQRIGHRHLTAICACQRFNGLNHMRVCANDDICAPICHFLRQRALGIVYHMAVFRPPVHTNRYHVRLLAGQFNLVLNDILLRGVNNIGLGPLRRGQAVGRFRIGQPGYFYAVLFLNGDALIVCFALPQAGGHHIVRHGGPKAAGGGNAFGPFVIGVVVGHGHHPHANVIHVLAQRGRGAEHGVRRWRELICNQCFLVDPVDVKPLIKRGDVLVQSGKVIPAAARALLRLKVEAVVYEVIPGGRDAQLRHLRLRLRRGLGRNRGSGQRSAFCRGLGCKHMPVQRRQSARTHGTQKPQHHNGSTGFTAFF